MAEPQIPKVRHPVCAEHWQKMRAETIKGLPFLVRPFASGTVNKMLRERGFVESETECSFCQTNSKVDELK